jgi:hypothetical protein
MKRLLLAGILLSILSVVAGGRIAWSDLDALHAALVEQVPVLRIEAGDWDPEWFVVDGRSPEAHEQGRPAASMSVPFEFRNRELFPVPDGGPVEGVVVLMEAGDPARARELALWVARQWGVARVGTFEGGWDAWKASGLPVEGGS